MFIFYTLRNIVLLPIAHSSNGSSSVSGISISSGSTPLLFCKYFDPATKSAKRFSNVTFKSRKRCTSVDGSVSNSPPLLERLVFNISLFTLAIRSSNVDAF